MGGDEKSRWYGLSGERAVEELRMHEWGVPLLML